MKISKELSIRKPEKRDIEDLYLIKNNRNNNESLGGFSLGYSEGDIANWIEFHNNKPDEALFLIENNEKQVIGHVGLYNIDSRVRKAEFAILIDEKFQGKGVGTACTEFMIKMGFGELNLNKIYLSLLSTNKRAYSLYKKMGFVEEGLLVQDQYKNNTYYDVILMALFNEK